MNSLSVYVRKKQQTGNLFSFNNDDMQMLEFEYLY